MKTKPLTFLLALAFLFFISSSSVYGERRDLAQAAVCIGDCMLLKPPLSSLSHHIFFEFDHWDLSDANRQILRDLSDVLKIEGSGYFMVVGGDRQGGGEENKTSSKLRVSMRGNLYLFVPRF